MQPDDYDLTGFKPAALQIEGTAVSYNRHGFPMASWRGIFGTTGKPQPPAALIDFDPEKPLPISLPRAA